MVRKDGEVMLTHLVVWKYKPEVEQAIRDEHVKQLRRLAGIISEIQTLAVGFDSIARARSFRASSIRGGVA